MAYQIAYTHIDLLGRVAKLYTYSLRKLVYKIIITNKIFECLKA